MGIRLAKTAGFCMGVKRAVDIVLDIARHKGDKKVYTYGPLIHNPQTVELLKDRGIVPVNSVDQIRDGIIVIRAHGISPLERKKIRAKGLEIVDATCPRVASVQAIIKKHAALGYSIIIIGDKKHPEVTSLLGYSSGRGIVISEKEDVASLPQHDRICVVAQTTQDSLRYKEIASEIAHKFPWVMVFDTICDSTEKRQIEIKEMSSEMDGIIIVGGKNSANTQRLATISRECGTRTCHIETVEELDGVDLSECKNIGVSAGASTPNWITESVIDCLTHNRIETGQWKHRGLYNLWIFLVKTDISSAIGAGCLSLTSMMLEGISVGLSNILIAALCVYAIQTINRLQSRSFGRSRGGFREESYIKHRTAYMTFAITSLVLASVFSLAGGLATFALVGFISFSGLLYNVTVGEKRLEDVPGSKTIFTALGWAVVTAMVPQISFNLEITCQMIVAFIFVFILVFSKSMLSDTIDIQSDRLIGRETIPVIMGKTPVRNLLRGILILEGVVLVAPASAGYTSPLSLILLVSVFYIWICMKLCDRNTQFSRVALEGLLGMNYLIAGLSAALWFIITKT
ncbi:MAG: 4-hydroxy-3-methylbut-2-enyl diphosphate reductase [Thermodesulfobacteriota bacterium]|nr:4-hydroxy-3-methylbut-2-enyl diphosphate reductase [Thermodesulfobacteriota bacterium]